MDAEQKTIWAYIKDLTEEHQSIQKELIVLRNVVIQMQPEEYIEHLKRVTTLSQQKEAFLRAKHGIQ